MAAAIVVRKERVQSGKTSASSALQPIVIAVAFSMIAILTAKEIKIALRFGIIGEFGIVTTGSCKA